MGWFKRFGMFEVRLLLKQGCLKIKFNLALPKSKIIWSYPALHWCNGRALYPAIVFGRPPVVGNCNNRSRLRPCLSLLSSTSRASEEAIGINLAQLWTVASRPSSLAWWRFNLYGYALILFLLVTNETSSSPLDLI